jgi:hypothetical protein
LFGGGTLFLRYLSRLILVFIFLSPYFLSGCYVWTFSISLFGFVMFYGEILRC